LKVAAGVGEQLGAAHGPEAGDADDARCVLMVGEQRPDVLVEVTVTGPPLVVQRL